MIDGYNNDINQLKIIHEDLYFELSQNIDEILGEEAYEQEKLELIDSLWSIFQKEERRLFKDNTKSNYNLNQQIPALNLFVLPSPYYLMPPLQQQPQQQQLLPLSYNFQPSMYPTQNFLTPQQLYQLPNFNINPIPLKKKKASKKIKKEKRQKDEKPKKKDKKQSKKEKSSDLDKSKITKLNYHLGDDFNGIINYLSTKTGGNVHINHTIEITTTSSAKSTLGNCGIQFIVDYKLKNNYYESGNDGNTVITFDFKDRRINVSNYTIRSMNTSNGHLQLRNWAIEVSNNGQNWIEIDRRENDGSLRNTNTVTTFDVKKKNESFYRYIRLRQTGAGWSEGFKSNAIGFKMIEFYGSIYEP